MQYLGNDSNLVRTADLAATNVIPSRVYRRIDEDEKEGSGEVRLSGDYTGQSSSVIEVEILDENGDSRRVTQPVANAAGSGSIADVEADLSVDPQTFVVRLEDLGIETLQARASLQGATLEAKPIGALGNLLRLSVDTSGLTATPRGYSLAEAITQGRNEYVGNIFDFDAPQLNDNGTIPDDAPRIRFGASSQVYYAYKKHDGEKYVYGFSPPPVADVPAGTEVFDVAGSYAITIIDDGIAGTPITGVVTLYDALVALSSAASPLTKVVSAIANDKTPGGQGRIDLSIRTAPFIAQQVRDGTPYVERAQIGLVPGPAAPSELLTIRCVDITRAGAERWEVSGPVSGRLPDAITNVLYQRAPYEFLIPLPDASTEGVVGDIQVSYRRPSGLGILPNFKPVRAVLGIGARNGTWVFEYQNRPIVCDADGVVSGGPNPDCLGLVPEGDSPMAMPRVMRRLQKLYEFRHEFSLSNTLTPPLGQEVVPNDDNPEEVDVNSSSVAEQDLAYINKASAELRRGINRLASDDAELDFDAWQTAKVYVVGDVVQATVSGTVYRFVATTDGTSGATEPTWTTTLDATYNDNGIVWENRGRLPLEMWDALFNLLKADAAMLKGTLYSTAGLGDWTASAAKVEGSAVKAAMYGVAVVTTAGTTGATLPEWPLTIGDTVSDGSVVWTMVARDSLRTEGRRRAIPDSYYQRYSSGVDAALSAAGIDPGFDGANILDGDGCWSDFPDVDRYFACITPNANYGHLFPNVYYHSSIKRTNEEGREYYETTKEFGFGAAIGCPEFIQIGDQIEVTITNVNGVSTYGVSDTIQTQIVRASPLVFSGGQTGNDLLTWSVTGSESGRIASYELSTVTPNEYNNDGLSFLITPGALAFQLGDSFTFSVQTARAQWRVDGGAYSAPFEIQSTHALVDGLVANFDEGASRSWIPGDKWTFRAYAVNGVDQLRRPDDYFFQWTDDTVIDIEPPSPEPIGGVAIMGHTIDPAAVITLECSDDDFATVALSVDIAWRESNIWQAVPADFAAYRLAISGATGAQRIQWLVISQPFSVRIAKDERQERGRLTKNYRMPGVNRRAGLGVNVEHTWVSPQSLESFISMLSNACDTEGGRFGVVPNETQPEATIVEYIADTLTVDDLRSFATIDPSEQRLSFAFEATAAR